MYGVLDRAVSGQSIKPCHDGELLCWHRGSAIDGYWLDSLLGRIKRLRSAVVRTGCTCTCRAECERGLSQIRALGVITPRRTCLRRPGGWRRLVNIITIIHTLTVFGMFAVYGKTRF